MCSVSSCAMRSRFSRSTRATLNRISVRLPGARPRQPDPHACWADSTAAFTSALSAAATSAKASSVAGLISLVRRPEAASRHAPLMKSWVGSCIYSLGLHYLKIQLADIGYSHRHHVCLVAGIVPGLGCQGFQVIFPDTMLAQPGVESEAGKESGYELDRGVVGLHVS